MAKSEFLISPLIENTPEFGLLYSGVGYLLNKKVTSFAIAPVGGEMQWEKTFKVIFKEMSNTPKIDISKLYQFDKIESNFTNQKISIAKQCEGQIDSINEAPLPSSLTIDNFITAKGWLAKSIKPIAKLPDSVLLVLTDSNGKNIFIKSRRTPRPDVGAYFKNSILDASGYTSTADVSGIKGKYTLGLAYKEGDNIKICPQFKIPGVFMSKMRMEGLNTERVSIAKKCEGFIDLINEKPASTSFFANQLLNIRGWLAKSVGPKAEVPDSVLLVLTDSEGKNTFINTTRTPRPDVGAHFKNSLLDASGYTASADVSNMNGNYTLDIAYTEGNDIEICPQFKIAGVFKNNPA